MYFDKNELNDKYSNVTELTIEGLKKIESEFLSQNVSLRKISLPDVVEIEYNFLENNEVLEEIYLPQVKSINFSFLSKNTSLKRIDLPNVQKIGSWFLNKNNQIKSIKFPELRVVGDDFMHDNEVLEEAIMPNVTEIGDDFLWNNRALKKLYVPKLEKKGSGFLILNSIYQKIEGEEDFSFRRSITNEIKDKILDIYNLSNSFHDDLVKIQDNLKKIVKDYGRNSNIYHRYSCFSLHSLVNNLLYKLEIEYDGSLRKLSNLFDFNIYINVLIDDLKSSQFDSNILIDILNNIQTMSDAVDISSGYDAYTIFENSSTKLTTIIQDIAQSITKSYFLTIRFIKCTLGNDEANNLLKRSTDDILKNIAFSVIVDRRFLPYVSDKINFRSLNSHTISELLEIEDQIYKDYIEFLRQDFYSFKHNDDNDNQDYEDFKGESNPKLCPNCGSVLDEDNWCNECLDFVEPEKDEIIETFEWFDYDVIEKKETLKTKKVDAIFNLNYQHNSNKTLELYEIPFDELILRAEKFKPYKFGGIKPVFFEFDETEYMFAGLLFIKEVYKKEIINGKKVLTLSDYFIFDEEKRQEFECIKESLEKNKYKIRNEIKHCPICGEFEYTPDYLYCDVCGWCFSSISEKYKDYQSIDNNLSFNEYKMWWIEKRKLDPNFTYEDDIDSYPVESGEIKKIDYNNWEYSLMGKKEVIIRSYNGDRYGIDVNDVKVPSEIAGKKVVGISRGSFSGLIDSILFPETIKFIETSSVDTIDAIKIFIPKSVEYIAKEAFGSKNAFGSINGVTLYIESDEIPSTWEEEFDTDCNNGEKIEIITGSDKDIFYE